MRWTRRACAVLAVGVLPLSACNREPPEPTVTNDVRGDWEDTGRYAACTLRGTPDAVCGELASFDVSGCDAGSLAGAARDGIYTMLYRLDATTPGVGAGSLRVSADGSLDSFRGVKPAQREVDADTFFLSSTRTQATSTTLRNSVVGCRAEGNRLYGCYVNCRDGRITGAGTFLAERWTRRADEAEASGLRLVSESFVDGGMPVDVYVTQGHAYVVSIPDGAERGGLTVFDVSNPEAPVFKTWISQPNDNYWNGVWAKGNALYVASASTGVVVFDISNPASPQLVKSVSSGPGGQVDVHTVFVEGDRLYAMSPSPSPRTFIYDIQKPTEPRRLGDYGEVGAGTNPQVGYPHDALAFEGMLYINHWSGGYVMVDVSDPASPKKVGAYTYPYATSHANAVGKFGDRRIAFEGGENWGAHLRVLDVTDPAQPKRIGEYELEENASIHNMVLKGERLYLAYYHHGVRVLDVSVPERPREVAYYNTFRETDPGRGESFYEGAIGMRVPGDGYVYVIDTSRGLLIFPEP
jgi:hypothetical protein